MNVGQLKELLSELPEYLLVVMSKDGEGNDFSPLAETQAGMYTADSTYSGYFNEEETVGDLDYEQPGDNAVTALCLWPTN